jgi:hypothetical protein
LPDLYLKCGMLFVLSSNVNGPANVVEAANIVLAGVA